MNIFEDFIEDIKYIILLLSAFIFASIMKSGTSMLSNPYNYIVLIILSVIALIDVLTYVLDMLIHHDDIEPISVFGSIIFNVIILIVALSIFFVYEKPLNISGASGFEKFAFFIFLFNIFSLIGSLINSFIPDEDEDDYFISTVVSLFEKIRLILFMSAFILMILDLYNIITFEMNISGLICGFTAVIMIIDILSVILDFVLGDRAFGDVILLIVNIILFLTIIVFCICGEPVINLFGALSGLPEITLSKGADVFSVGVICYFILDIIVCLPINIIANIADAISY